MKKFALALLGLSALSLCSALAQTNSPSSTSTSLTPPSDTAPASTSSTTTTTTVITPAAPPATVAPTPTMAPAVVAPAAPSAPVYVAPRPAPPARVVTIPHTSVHSVARPYHLTPIAWIVRTRDNLDDDDRYVTIIGHVNRRIGDDEYWFSDGTGSVRLDSENFDLPIGRRIVVGGRIDQAWLGFGHLEVDVRRWRYAN